MKSHVYIILASFVALGSASGQSLVLNFGTVSDPTFNQGGDLRTNFTGVYAGINASLTAANAFPSTIQNNNGSVGGDLRVNMTNNNTVDLAITLWDANAGNGFDTPYNPAGTYDWSFVFYDIDGGGPSNPNFYDSVKVYTPGSYTLSGTSRLVVSQGSGYVNFSGESVGDDIPGQNGITPPFTQEQADVSVVFKVSNTPQMNFNYSVGPNTNPTAHRNLLIDANDFLLELDAFSPVTVAVPEPSSFAISLLGASFLGLRRRRKA